MKLYKFYNQAEGGGGGGYTAPASGPGPGASESIGMHTPTPQPQSAAPSGLPQPQYGGQGQGQSVSAPQFGGGGFDYDRFAQAQARALAQLGIGGQRHEPSKPQSPFGENPSKFWFIPDAEGVDGGREFHQRFETGVNYMLQQALAPIHRELQQARQALGYVNALKATDPALAAAESEFTQLVDQGVPVQFAREFVLLKHKSQSQAQQGGSPSQPFAQPGGAFVPQIPNGFGGQGQPEFGAGFVQAASQRPPALPVPQVPPHAMQGGGRQAPPGAGPRFDPQQKPDMNRIMTDLLQKAGYQV